MRGKCAGKSPGAIRRNPAFARPVCGLKLLRGTQNHSGKLVLSTPVQTSGQERVPCPVRSPLLVRRYEGSLPCGVALADVQQADRPNYFRSVQPDPEIPSPPPVVTGNVEQIGLLRAVMGMPNPSR